MTIREIVKNVAEVGASCAVGGSPSDVLKIISQAESQLQALIDEADHKAFQEGVDSVFIDNERGIQEAVKAEQKRIERGVEELQIYDIEELDLIEEGLLKSDVLAVVRGKKRILAEHQT